MPGDNGEPTQVLNELKEGNKLLGEIVKWIRVTSIPNVKKILEENLSEPSNILAYHYSDGNRGSQEVAKLAGVHFTTIAGWWKIWIRIGIAEPVSVQRGDRCKRIFLLEDFGIEIPKGKTTKSTQVQSDSDSDG